MDLLTTKKELILHHTNVIECVKTLSYLSEDNWRAALAKDQWSVAEIIGHLIAWDRFVLEKRIPYLITCEPMPISPNVEEMNVLAAAEGRKQSQKVLIEKFITTRSQLQQNLKDLHEDLWVKEYSIGTSKINVYDYFIGLAKHDQHHLTQIRNFIT
jgi:hypothetical protein